MVVYIFDNIFYRIMDRKNGRFIFFKKCFLDGAIGGRTDKVIFRGYFSHKSKHSIFYSVILYLTVSAWPSRAAQ